MPRQSTSPPKYRRHKASGQAVVTFNGRDYYLGPHGTSASKREYDRLVAEWLARGRVTPTAGPEDALTVVELAASYLLWAKSYYQGPSREVRQIVYAFRPLRGLYGLTNASEFGPIALKAVRQRMIDDGLCRTEINKRVGRIKRLFKWGVENELIPPSVFHGLETVSPDYS